jgi:hypothetical protein
VPVLTVCFRHPSEEALNAAVNAPEDHAAAADIPNFADGGVTMFVAHD